MRSTEQMNMLGAIDRYERAKRDRELAIIREKLLNDYETGREVCKNPDGLPDGLVVVVSQDRWIGNITQTFFYRCVVGHHRTVSGLMAHLISAPNEEWPEAPPWQYDKEHECQWIYPPFTMWIRKEREYEPGVQWKQEGG